MRVILAFVIKEFRQLIRDPFLPKFLLAAPILQLLLLGFALTLDVKHVPLLVCDRDGGPEARALLERLAHNDRFDLAGRVESPEALERGIWRREGKVGLYIPPDFGLKLEREGSSSVMVLLDAVDGNGALTAYGYLVRSGVTAGPEVRYLFNPDLRNEAWMIPGIVVLIITIVSLLMSALVLVREKERGTLEQLNVTPVRRGEIIAGKLLPFLIYSFFELLMVLGVAMAVFRLRPSGSPVGLLLAVTVYLPTTLGLGLFISTVSRTQQQALFLAWFFMIFMILLSGFFIPVDNMPPLLRAVTAVNPLRWMMTIVRDIWLKGATPLQLWDQYLPMALIGVVCLGGSILTFNKKAGS